MNPVRFKRHAGKLPRRLPRDLSNDAVEQLWAVIPTPRDRAWFVLMLRAGLRVGEVVSLRLTDVLVPPQTDQPARLRVCGKGQKERLVLLTADAYAVLKVWLECRPASDQPQVFLNDRGSPLTSNGIEWLLHQYGAQVELAVTPHQLRHTYARQLTEAGMPITSLSKLLGHAQVSTTQLYTAGADPELVQAYQTAMAQLARQTLPARESPPPAPTPAAAPLPPAQPTVPQVEASPAPLPEWADVDAGLARRVAAGQPGLCSAQPIDLPTQAPAAESLAGLGTIPPLLDLATGAPSHHALGRIAAGRFTSLPR